MNKRIKNLWLKALRSGQYDQTENELCISDPKKGDSFCCLGVLTDLYLREKGLGWRPKHNPYNYGDNDVYTYGNGGDLLPKSVAQWAGLLGTNVIKKEIKGYDIYIQDEDITASALNDSGASFKQIADIFEREL